MRLHQRPMRRARETPGVLSEELGLPVEASESIHELRESDEYLALPPEEQKLWRWSVWMAEHGHDASSSLTRCSRTGSAPKTSAACGGSAPSTAG
jgi:broad specificity phosphatase PhoE